MGEAKTKKDKKALSCSECGVHNCRSLDGEFPEFCLTKASAKENEEALAIYRTHPEYSKAAKASGEVEGIFYRQLTRAEEIIEFAKRIGAKKIGIATCAGLAEEARVFARVVEAKGLASYSVLCKVGATDKTAIGIRPEDKINKGAAHESLCNPILQAKLLNKKKTDLNVLIGLCVGHDALFCRHSDALATTLIAKDRLLGHNPVAALYTAKTYNKQLLAKD
ncbi:MAG: DUF1847 domain-containing protein [Acidaminococcales bacterium]|jgi:uncharacterized metal-binding protein|nr:DUF1847 domain-containing protein [Acidaminococcales bacterium]